MPSSTKVSTACTSPCGRRTRDASRSSATSTSGTAAGTRCGCAWAPASGRSSSRRSPRARSTSTRSSAPTARSFRSRPIPSASARSSGRRPRRWCATPTRFAWADADWMRGAGRARPAPRADVDLRSASGLVAPRRRQPLAHLRRARRCARAVRGRHGLHASRAHAGQRASAGRLLGLPADRALRADEPLRRACRVRPLRRSLPSRADRRDRRLGAGALSGGPARPRAVRRHGALRARRSAPRLPSRLEHGDLQLRPARGRELPRSRARSSGSTAITSTGCASTPSPRCSISTTRARTANGCRTRTAATRTSRRSPFCGGSTKTVYARHPGRDHDRRGVDGVARGEPADLRGRPGLRLQVEHGLDARHARVPEPRIRCTGAGTTTR